MAIAIGNVKEALINSPRRFTTVVRPVTMMASLQSAIDHA
jgi:hypothetical protein